MSCRLLLPAFRLGEGDNDAKVVHFFDIRGMYAAFSLGKACGYRKQFLNLRCE